MECRPDHDWVSRTSLTSLDVLGTSCHTTSVVGEGLGKHFSWYFPLGKNITLSYLSFKMLESFEEPPLSKFCPFPSEPYDGHFEQKAHAFDSLGALDRSKSGSLCPGSLPKPIRYHLRHLGSPTCDLHEERRAFALQLDADQVLAGFKAFEHLT